ncbi:MAG: hypothetical protein Q8862_05595 [Bacteroidota bacterium]|nr:hypothetical protein [Bacteroidota bacterium]
MKYIFLLMLMNIGINAYSQIELHIAELSASNIVLDPNRPVFTEGEDEGPEIGFRCYIQNNTDKEIILQPQKARVNILFNYKNKKYESKVNPLPFFEFESITIKPHDSYEFFGGDTFLCGTDLWDQKRTDYTLEMLEILPTIKISYRDPNINITSTDINTVVIDYPSGRWYLGNKPAPSKRSHPLNKKSRK